MFRDVLLSFNVVTSIVYQPVASDVEVVGYL